MWTSIFLIIFCIILTSFIDVKLAPSLEKEALAKGVPIGQALDIEIPPPRPKRKPSNPYPRKTGAVVGAKDGKSEMLISSLHCKQVLDLEKEPLPERANGDERPRNLKGNQDDSCSEVFTLLHEANCSCVFSVNKNSTPTSAAIRNSCTFREFVPSLKEDNGTSKASNLENSCISHEKSAQGQKKDDLDGDLRTDEIQATQNYPRHDSVFHPMGDVHGQPNMFANPAVSATNEHQNNAPRSTHQAFPTFHTPFMHVRPNQEDYRSFLHVSSTFSSLIVSTLLQNPAAHAAASFAATFWPYANVESSADSPACSRGGFPSRHMNSAPSRAAIAAATVAAATAWWAAHGLLPVCAPLHTGFTCAPASTAAAPPMENGQAPAAKTERKDNTDHDLSMQDQQLDPEYSEALQGQHSASKSPTSSSSDCEESGNAKVNTEVKAADNEKAGTVTESQDANKTNRKQVERSSCGSNTPSSIEVETDMLEKHEKDKEDSKGADANHPQVRKHNVIAAHLVAEAISTLRGLDLRWSGPITPSQVQYVEQYVFAKYPQYCNGVVHPMEYSHNLPCTQRALMFSKGWLTIRKKMVKGAKKCLEQKASKSMVYGRMQEIFAEMDSTSAVTETVSLQGPSEGKNFNSFTRTLHQ
ncbi:hypothetical protein CRYUN_Cryun25bG0034700 [Craigia yunnanensis]